MTHTELPHIEPGIYEHFKGQRYEVYGIARHSETEEVFVSYRTLYGDHSLWVRPIAMFTEVVERDGYSGPRFRRVGSPPAGDRPDDARQK
ncbi:DUF1653 domain-containing protein [Microbacterium testaceum]|uniref:DUF1653 domain-containing protein n=1 Tax=Microbacterium testaceum TaxID=2033 RepID=UPI0012479273|nr:DUF1653 domain-containing protein [Microbacterium testaceum]